MTDWLQAKVIVDVVMDWAKSNEDVRGVALVGSYARNAAQPNSDIDLIVLAGNPDTFRDCAWMSAIDWSRAGVNLTRWSDEDYGAVWSRRLWFQPEGEAELGFASLPWADVSPVGPGTRMVVSDGCQVLYDPDRRLERLVLAVTRCGSERPI